MATIFERRNRLLEEQIEKLVGPVMGSPVTKSIPTLIPNSKSGFGPRSDWIISGTKTGQTVPGHRQKIRLGLNATSPYQLDKVFLLKSDPLSYNFEHEYFVWDGSKNVVLYSAAYRQGGYIFDMSQTGVAIFGHSVALSSADEAAALSRVYSKIREDSYGVNGLLFLGEFRELLHMLKNPLDSMRTNVSKYLDTLKSTRKEVQRKVQRRKSDTSDSLIHRRLNAVKEGVAGSWLELQYGALPAISDAKGILTEAHQIFEDLTPKKRKRIVVRQAVAPQTSIWIDSISPVTSALQSRVLVTKKSTARLQYVVGMNHEVSGPVHDIEGALQRFGFQFQNFVPTIYELIPYSFLVDYFVNLGKIVEASCTDTSAVGYISKTYSSETQTTVWDKYEPYSDSNWRPGPACSGKQDSTRVFRHITVDRSKPDSLGLPPLVVSLPGIDSTKWFNMAALLGASKNFRFRGI